MSWTDERVTQLKQMWGEGKTAAEIARQLGDGVTRNAVIGKAHRLKLSGRISPIQQNKKAKVKKVEKKSLPPKRETMAQKIQKISAPDINVVAINGGKGVSMLELNERMCRWPSGDPQDDNFSFCGCKSVPSLPYCEGHVAAAYQISSKARPLNAKDFEEKQTERTETEEIAVQVA